MYGRFGSFLTGLEGQLLCLGRNWQRKQLVPSKNVEKVDNESGKSWYKGEHKAKGAVLGVDVVANDECNSAKGESVDEEGNNEQIFGREESDKDQLVDGVQKELFHGVGQNAHLLVNQFLVGTERIPSLGETTSEHDMKHNEEQRNQ